MVKVGETTPQVLFARAPQDEKEEHRIPKLALSRHVPGDRMTRATMIVGSWERERTTRSAAELGCHPQTARGRIVRFNAEGIDGLGDRLGARRKPRLTEEERGRIIALARSDPPGKPVRMGEELGAVEPEKEAHWSLDALARAAHEKGIQIERSQIRRILLKEGIRWRHPRSWAESTDPEFVPKERGSAPFTPTHRRERRSSVSMRLDP